MSELKAISSGEIYNIIEYEGSCITDDLYYPKSEADKVFAEKDKEISRLNDKALQYKVLDKEHCRDLNTQERRFALQMAHHKYKRCLAMAMWCWAIKELNLYGDQDYIDFAEKWRKRWLELAKEFKREYENGRR